MSQLNCSMPALLGSNPCISIQKFAYRLASSRSSRKRSVRLAPGLRRSFKLVYTRHGGLLRPGNPKPAPLNVIFPAAPPIHSEMDIVRMRGTLWPLNGPESGVTIDLSPGHLKMPAALPQYGQSGLSLISCSTFQFDGLPGVK